jgi:hypothetical protein
MLSFQLDFDLSHVDKGHISVTGKHYSSWLPPDGSAVPHASAKAQGLLVASAGLDQVVYGHTP